MQELGTDESSSLGMIRPNSQFYPLKNGDYARILSAINVHRLLTYGLTALAVLLVLLQLSLGITISVLTSIQGGKAKTAVIILGAINSFVGGLAGILQYWGQPTRESRYFSSLKLVRDDVESLLGEFKNRNTLLDPWNEGNRVWDSFKQANKDAWSNEPMIWLQNTRTPGTDDQNPPRG
jgi:SMODS and SLOG-associating 2TM effector domain